MSARLLAVLVIVAATAQAPRAQRDAQAPPAPPDPPRPTRLSAIVTDRQGRPITGLAAKDFHIKDDEVAQTIESVTPRPQQPRRLALLLDEFHVADANAPRVREAVTAFVDKELRKDDLVVVLKPLDSLPAIQLTNDKDVVLRAIASFEGRAGNYTPRTPLEEQTVGRAPALAESARAQIVLSGMRALATRLGGPDGRAALVVVSEGFVQEPHIIPVRALPDLGVVERFANRYDVPVYAIDPRVDAPPPAPDGPDAMLRRLAAQTGGVFTSGGQVGEALEQLVRDLDGGYEISYRPMHGDDAKYHAVDLKVTRRDAQVRTRAGYVSPPSAETRRAMRALVAPPVLDNTRPTRRSPLIDVWSGITRAADSRGRVMVTWEPGRPIGATAKPPVTSVMLKARTKDGTLLYDGPLVPMRSPLESAGLPADRAEFDAPAGRVLLDMTLLGERGEKLDEDARDVEVPTFKGPGPLLLPPMILVTQSAREFHEVTADQDAAPAPSRSFRRTERLLVRVPAYLAGGDAADVSARLLNRLGQLVRELDRIPGPEVRGVTQFDLPLAPLAPGEYYLQLTARGSGVATSQRISFTITG